jgi:WD40 repeat protein
MSVALSPDGKLIALGGALGTVDIVDLDSGESTMTLQVGDPKNIDSTFVFRLNFSPDGSTLAAMTDTISLWNVADGQKLQSLPLKEGGSVISACSSDGSMLAVGEAAQVVLYRVNTMEAIQTFEAEDYVLSVEFSPDDTQLAIVPQGSGSILLWDLASMQLVEELRYNDTPFRKVGFSADGNLLAADTRDSVILWRMSNGQVEQVLEAYQDYGGSSLFSPNSKTLINTGRGDSIFWDVNTWVPTTIWKGHADLAQPEFAKDGNSLFYIEGNNIVWWDVASQEPKDVFDANSAVDHIALSHAGQHLASASGTTVDVWDIENGEIVRSFENDQALNSIAFSPADDLLAASSTNAVSVWDIADSTLFQEIDSEEIQGVVFSPDNSLLAVRSPYTGALVDLTGNEPNLTLEHEDTIDSLAFSPDGSLLAVKAGDHVIWDVASGDRVVASGVYQGGFSSVSFSHDSELLASMGWGGDILLWDWELDEIATLERHGAPSFSNHVTFSPTNNMLASNGSDGTIIIWDLATYNPFEE